jgi:predicted aspartyl protease
MVVVLVVVAAVVPAAGTGAQSGSGAIQVPINVLSGPHGQKLVEADVTVSGNKLPFVIDTGASSSAIELHVAKLLRLPKSGRAHHAVSAGCTPKSQPVTMSGWTLGGVTLPTISHMEATKLGLRGIGAVGLLGSDVLSTFDKISIDYVHKVMTLRG